ncbi:LPS-assembly protein LptD, partial [Bacteroides sp. OttesenSCG-928-F21]|nr:LPS-assembly protein LptD [Bacteroides sp. OttesenSCG-928-F21]
MKATAVISIILLFIFLLIPEEAVSQRRRRGTEPTERYTAPPFPTDSLARDSLPQDTLRADTVAEKKKQPLDVPVEYESSDSTVFEMGGYAHLYGDGKINYGKTIELTAAIITMNMDSSSVYARGRADSLGITTGDPVFKDGETPYETKAIRYNFKSKRGLISNVITQQGEGYVVGKNAKKGANDELFLSKGIYTTCDHHDHPHFYLQMTRAKVRPKKNVVTGPAYLVVEDVPLPLAVPFFFFPFSSSYSSGFIMPSYMDDSNRGFGLSGGGYYFAIDDTKDLKVIGDIFTKGSWSMGVESNYLKRYKYSGSLQANYQVTKTGDKGMPDYAVAKDFKISWTHRQDAKANPNSTFSASVNFTTSSYERQNLGNYYNPQLTSQNTKTSSVSYSRSFPDQKLNISSTFNIAQNMKDSSIAITLPDLNISLSRVFPFKKKNRVGDEKWYEKISLSYTGRITNSIRTKDDLIFKSSLVKDWTNGMNHNIPISATFTIFNYFNVTPSFNYTERWYTKKIMQDWNTETNRLAPTDTVYGFHRVYNYSASVSLSTKVYGMYQPLFMKSKEIQIRHVITPQLSVNAAPDFGSSSYGYYKDVVYTDQNGEVRTTNYSPFTGQPFGVPGKGRQGNISFDLSNNIEMKIKSDKDTTGYRKISLIDELGAQMSYNTAAKIRPWGDLQLRLRLKLSKSYTFNLNTSFATYAYDFDKDGRVITGERTEWSYGRFGRFQGWNTSFSYTFNNDTWKKWFGKEEEEKKDEKPEGEQDENKPLGNSEDEEGAPTKKVVKAKAGADGYQEFKMPWALTFSYGVRIFEDKSKPINEENMRYPYSLSHNLNVSGNIKLSNKWNTSFNSGYDFEAKKISPTTFNISRDLHCFNITATLSPFGVWKSYSF